MAVLSLWAWAITGILDSTEKLQMMTHDQTAWSSTVLVGTHHKTGTLLLAKIFRLFAREMGIPRLRGNLSACNTAFALRLPAVCFDQHVDAHSLQAWVSPTTYFIHSVREPLEMCVSAYQYHNKGTEPWLTRPLRDLNGTLQQYYGRITIEDGVRFECKRLVSEMVESALVFNATRDNANVHTMRAEDTALNFNASMASMFAFIGAGPRTDRLMTLIAHFDLSKNAPADASHVSSTDEKGSLRHAVLEDDLLRQTLHSLGLLLRYTDGQLPSARSLCDQLQAVCATTNVSFFTWCVRGQIQQGDILSLPRCGEMLAEQHLLRGS